MAGIANPAIRGLPQSWSQTGCGDAVTRRHDGLRVVRLGVGLHQIASNGFMNSSFVCGAGRSKAKKGGRGGPGGKIERRPPPPQKTSGRRGGASDKQLDGKEKGLNTENSRVVESERSGSEQEDGVDEDDISWMLTDVRSSKNPTEKKATRLVGGWGRDKSMQREVPVTTRADRVEQAKASVIPNRKKAPAVVGIPNENPNVIHPPEYYKYGPFGPHAWKGIPVGDLIEGTLATNQVVFFSTDADEEEAEDREKANLAVDYTEMVDKFNPEIGVQFYYAFARRKFGPRQEPWRDWTLVAQIAVEQGEVIDQQRLFIQLTKGQQATVLKCVAWSRPDLIYTKKPQFQLRLEPQEEFTTELFNLLNSTSRDSYYHKFCNLLNVEVSSSPKETRSAFQALDAESKLRCLEHLFTNHPVKVLSSARYDREVLRRSSRSTDEDSGEAVSVDGHDLNEDSLDDEDVQNARGLIREVETVSAEEQQLTDYNSTHDTSTRERANTDRVDGSPGHSQETPSTPEVNIRAAIRPFEYSNFVEEIAFIHNILHGEESDFDVDWIREAVGVR